MILTKKTTTGILFILLLSFFIQSIGSMNYHSLFADEAMDISAGFSYIKTGSFDKQNNHPPLAMLIGGIPLILLGAEFPQSWDTLTVDALYARNTNIDQLVFWARIPTLLLGLALGILIYQWSSRLYGPKGGLFSLFVFCFNPLLISNFHLALTEGPMTFFAFFAVFVFYRYLHEPETKTLLITGVLLGLALLSKVLSFLLIPLFVLFLLSHYGGKLSNREKVIAMTAILGVGFFVTWAGYGFETGTISSKIFNPDRVSEPVEKLPDVPFLKSGGKFFMEKVPIPFPNYIKGIYLQSQIPSERGYPVYLWGDVRESGGFREYYLIGFLLKTPLPLIIFTIGALWAYRKTKFRDEILFLLAPVLLYFIVGSINPLQDGMRYLIIIYPFIAVMAGKFTEFDSPKTRPVILVLCIWYLVGTISIFPHYEAYYNEVAGGPDGGHKYLIGRSDGGQQFKLLQEYMGAEGIDEIKIAKYGGWIPQELEYRGIAYQNLTCEKTTGIVVIGARELYGESRYGEECFGWLRTQKPIERICHTLFIFNITA